jgi:hypothetical protein
MFIFFITDKNKFFTWEGRGYNTPCKVIIHDHRQINIFHNLMKKNSIRHIQVENKFNKRHKLGVKKESILGTGSVSLSLKTG